MKESHRLEIKKELGDGELKLSDAAVDLGVSDKHLALGPEV